MLYSVNERGFKAANSGQFRGAGEIRVKMSLFDATLSRWKLQVEQARDRIRIFESRKMPVHDTYAPFKDWTTEAIAIEKQIIASLEAGIKS